MTIGPKPGRPETNRVRIVPIETLPCGDTMHRIEVREEDDFPVGYCTGCGRRSRDLDAEMRAGLPKPKPHHGKGVKPVVVRS